MKFRIVSFGLALAMLVCARQASATVTATAWYHFGEGGVPIPNDATTNANTFNAVYYQNGIQPLVGPQAVGGPLGDSGYISSSSARFGYQGAISQFFRSGTLNTATTNYYVPPATNYGMEIWFLPQNTGFIWDSASGQEAFTPIFASGGSIYGAGPGGGAAIVIRDDHDGTSSMQAAVVHQGDSAAAYSYFGPSILVDTNHWIHLALVNDNGILTFYTNGVPCATNDNSVLPLTAPAGSLFIGRDGGHVSLDGYVDEARIFTFAPGAFGVTDLLYTAAPRLIAQPQNTTVWNGGAANFTANTSFDPANTYQWYQGTGILSGQTGPSLNLDPVALANSGNVYDCAVTNGGNGMVSSNATLTVVPVQTANVNVYRTAVTGNPNLLAYFPVDGSTGSTLANTVNASYDGTLQLSATYDGQTNRAFGQSALYLLGNGDVQVPSNVSYEFSGGNGTIEALIYLTPSATGQNGTIFSIATADGTGIHYAFGASGDGTTLTYTNDAGVSLAWAVPANLLNRFAHVALVFSGTTSVTAYLDGKSLGTQSQSGFGSASGVPVWIGSLGSGTLWNGTIDEVAVYGSALSAATIAVHNSDFIYGTNTAAPTITGESPSTTLYAGGSPVLSVVPGGTPPFSYQWLSNGIAITGATNGTFTLAQTTGGDSAAYTVVISNPFGSITNTSTPITLTFVAPPTGYAAVVMKDNPSAYWRLNEASGTTMKDYAGGLDGIYSGALTLGAPGVDSDTAVSFAGTTGKGEVPFSSVLNPSGPFSVEFWAQANSTATMCPVASVNRIVNPNRFGYNISANNTGNGWTTQMGNASGGGIVLITGVTPVVPGSWYNVVMTYDGGSNVTLYVNGYVDGSNTNAGNGNFLPNTSTNVPFEVGQRNLGGLPFDGTVDEVAFYNYVLTQTQIQKHVAVGLPLKLGIGANSDVVADTKPVGLLYNGFNAGTAWLASDSDGTTTRSGVMQFTAIANTNNADQVYVPAYPVLTNCTNGTIMFWVHAGTNVPTSGANQGSGDATLFQWRNNNGGCGFFLGDDGTLFIQAMNNYCHFSSIGNVGDGKWHHVAFVYDQSSAGAMTNFIDGTLDSFGFNSHPWYWTITATIELGQDFNDGYWENYNGNMDDVRMYNRILTPAEIASAMGGALVDTNALVLRLNFDKPPGGLAVTWPYGSLQTGATANGGYTTITNAVSPFPVAPGTAPQSYFRGLR